MQRLTKGKRSSAPFGDGYSIVKTTSAFAGMLQEMLSVLIELQSAVKKEKDIFTIIP